MLLNVLSMQVECYLEMCYRHKQANGILYCMCKPNRRSVYEMQKKYSIRSRSQGIKPYKHQMNATPDF